MKKKKRIGILTLPIKSNYGGILQAFALQYFLKDKGFDAWLIRRRWNCNHQSLIHKLIKYIYHTLIIRQFNNFINKYIHPQTSIIYMDEDMKRLNSQFDAFIVGSDQIWRMRFVTGVGYNYFLDFADDDKKKIAYAASFGVGYWDDDHTDINKPIVKRLLQRFDALSVREKSGIDLCSKEFNVTASHVLDPTMLLCKDIYCKMFNIDILKKPYIAVYLLDDSPNKRTLLSHVSKHLNLPVKYINQTYYTSLLPSILKSQIKPGIISWIKGIAEASFVITDSFHGTVFSIIFQKQFYSIDNSTRGSDRFTSLLGTLQLTERLINEMSLPNLYNEKIDYNKVEATLSNMRMQSSSFLIRALS